MLAWRKIEPGFPNQPEQVPVLPNKPLLGDFGYLADCVNAQEVLKGDYILPPDTDPYATKLLEASKMPNEIRGALHGTKHRGLHLWMG